MTAKRIPALTALTGAATANDDDLVIFDTSANETKRISRVEFFNNIPSNFASKLVITNVVGNHTVVAGDLGTVINCTLGAVTVSLTPAATLGAGFNCWIWNSASSDIVTIDPSGAQTIDGLSTLILRVGEGTQIICDGTNWQTGDKKTMRGYAENIASGSTRASASGTSSQAMGSGASASGSNSQAIGPSTTASASRSSAIGQNSSGQGSQAVTGSGAMALGGSYASGTNSVAAAIGSNTGTYGAKATGAIAIGNSASVSFNYGVSVGYLATVSGTNGIAIGVSATASGSAAIAISGNVATASGASSIAIGDNTSATAISAVCIGTGSSVTQNYGFAFGYNALSNVIGKYAYTGTTFGVDGDAQTGTYVLARSTTNATPTDLTTNTFVVGATNQIVLLADSTLIFRGQLVARNTASDTDSVVWEFKGAVRRGATAATTTLIGTPSIDLIASDGSSWTFALTADTTNGALKVTVTGEAGKTIRWVATVNTTEVAG